MMTGSVPFVRRQRDATALGTQQAQRLQQLREASERHVHEQHLQASRGTGGVLQQSGEARNDASRSPVFPHSARASRTVEAVIESRLASDTSGSKAQRLRTTIRDARGGLQTERAVDTQRPRTTTHGTEISAMGVRPATNTAGSTKTMGIRQKVAAVRRLHPETPTKSRKPTREELEWVEKQLQYTQRVARVEKECMTWWRNYYASAGGAGSAGDGGEDGVVTPLSIQKQLDNCEQRRFQDARDLQDRLNELRARADHVMNMVHAMRDGTEFIADLQTAMDAFESVLSLFRIAQREQFDSYVLEEKLLDRDLAAFVLKIETWEQDDTLKTSSKGTLRATKISERVARVGRSDGPSRARRDVEEDAEVDFHPDSPNQSNSVDEVSDRVDEYNTKGEVDMVKRVRHLNNQILQSGGLKGGWDDREHAIFSSTLLKCGLTDDVILANQFARHDSNQVDQAAAIDFEATVAKFLRKCMKVVVTKSENAVRNHFDWYVSHLHLIQEKKSVIQQWKQKKEIERQELIRQGLHQVALENDNETMHTSGTNVGVQQEEEKVRQKDREDKDRMRKLRKLESWREEKERRAVEKLEEERETRIQREAREAKKRQELLEKKQQLLLYKLQKEEETAALQRNRAHPSSSRSPVAANDEALLERSRKAIETARAKRAKLQAIEERRQKQQELPERPRSIAKRRTSESAAGSPTDSEGSPSSRDVTLLKPTKAHEARRLTKLELKQMEKERARLGAHDAYFPGAGVVSDVKIKSFGHIAIAPRAVPTWRQNI